MRCVEEYEQFAFLAFVFKRNLIEFRFAIDSDFSDLTLQPYIRVLK